MHPHQLFLSFRIQKPVTALIQLIKTPLEISNAIQLSSDGGRFIRTRLVDETLPCLALGNIYLFVGDRQDLKKKTVWTSLPKFRVFFLAEWTPLSTKTCVEYSFETLLLLLFFFVLTVLNNYKEMVVGSWWIFCFFVIFYLVNYATSDGILLLAKPKCSFQSITCKNIIS